MNKSIQFYGPFFSNYSYARISRGLAFGINNLNTNYTAYFSANPETVDYYPSEKDLATKPDIKNLFKPYGFESDVVIYNNYPKTITSLNGLDQLPGKLKLMFLSWEESTYPKEWVNEINANLHGVLAITQFVKNVLIKSGVKVPIQVIPLGVNQDWFKNTPATYKLKTRKQIKFYHNSTGKKRKGVDLLIKAYFELFTNQDDVCLVIKTTPQVENQFLQLIDQYKSKTSPEIELIVNDLSDEEMASLQSQVSASIYPSRAEGFGIPALESMLLEKPVIVTNYGGFTDFCDNNNSYLINCNVQNIDPAEILTPGAKWAEPDFDHLKTLIKKVYKALTKKDSVEGKELLSIVENGKKTATNFNWDSSADLAIKFINQISSLQTFKTKNFGVLSFFNDETGIADYTEDLYKSVESSFKKFYYLSNSDLADRTAKDASNVIRCWTTGESTFEQLISFVKKEKLDIVHVQYHSGSMFPIKSLDLLIEKLKELNIESYLTFHAVRGPSFDFIKESKNLLKWSKIFIHNKSDFEYAKESLNNAIRLPLPTVVFNKRNKLKLKKELGLENYQYIFATHGLLNKHKNIPQVIKAISNILKDYPNTLFLGLNAVSANNIYAQSEYQECVDLISKLKMETNAFLITKFLSDAEIEILMQTVDATIFAYNDVGESASASINKSLASGGVTIVTNINMFIEFDKEVLRISQPNAIEIEKSLRLVIEDENNKVKLLKAADEYVKNNTYDKRVVEMLNMY